MKLNFSLKKAKFNKVELAAGLILLAAFILPFLSWAGSEEVIYVNANASGVQDGSKNHPYKTIGQAIKKSDEDTEIHVSKGTYEENIELPKGVELHGSGNSEVFIQAKNDDEPVIRMQNETKIVSVTVEEGEYGVEVSRGDSAKIIDCNVRKNNKDGIRIKEGETSERDQVDIVSSYISKNGRAGIYSEKRKLSIVNNLIEKNDGDGIAVVGTASIWMSGNSVKNNEGSGMRVNLDGSNISAKRNLFSENNREGIEINSFGSTGKIDIQMSKFRYNGRWGIAKINRVSGNFSAWNGLIIDGPSIPMFGNSSGSVSPILTIFY